LWVGGLVARMCCARVAAVRAQGGLLPIGEIGPQPGRDLALRVGRRWRKRRHGAAAASGTPNVGGAATQCRLRAGQRASSSTGPGDRSHGDQGAALLKRGDAARDPRGRRCLRATAAERQRCACFSPGPSPDQAGGSPGRVKVRDHSPALGSGSEAQPGLAGTALINREAAGLRAACRRRS